MAKIVMGRYIEGDSFFHRINPLVKITLFLLTTIFSLILFNFKEYLVFSTIILLSISLSGIGFSRFIASIKPVLLIFIWTFIFQILFSREGSLIFSFSIIKIYSGALTNSILVFFKMFVLIGIASILTLTTSPTEVTHGFEDFFKPLKLIKVPVSAIALTISIALRFIPVFFDEIERIKIAQTSKGYEVEELKFIKKFKYYAVLLIPLLLSAIKKSENIADAMEIRGYSIKGKKTRFREYFYKREDFILIGIYLILIVFIIIL